MMRSTIWKSMRLMALAAAVSISLGSVAWGQSWGYHDSDDYRNGEAREHGYQNGYRDGQRQAQYDAQRGRRFNYKNEDWEDSRGFEHWMGSKGDYKRAYRDGYEQAYRRTFDYYGYHDRYRDRDDRRYDRDDDR